VTSFKQPTANELAHDYLWRIHQSCPSRGEIGVFNRSHYEDLVTTRVLGIIDEKTWRRRYRHVREFERMLADEGTSVVKIYLNLSYDEQRVRLQERIDNPAKSWKFRLEDLETRGHWDDYIGAYEEAITETSTEWAPWYVVPADRNWVRNLAVAEIFAHALKELDPKLPEPDPRIAGVQIT
jgi:PPK2 family polyphosphate:nucleotide phosphotransferase